MRRPDRKPTPLDPTSLPALETAFRRLQALSELDADWDSYGGLPPSPQAIAAAHRLLVDVGERCGHLPGHRVVPSAVVPLADGGVQVEWRGPFGDLEVEVRSADDLGFLYIDRRSAERTFEEADDISWASALELVDRVLSD